MTDSAKFYGVDFHVWNRVVGVQRHTLDRVLLAAALCPETVDSRRVWRRPKSVSDAVSMASECWGEDAERRIKSSILSFFSWGGLLPTKVQLLQSARFDIRLAAWLAACYSKVAVDFVKEFPEHVGFSYRFAFEDAQGRTNEADLIRASEKATLEMMRWVKDGKVDAAYYGKLAPFSGRFDTQYVYVFHSTWAAARFVRSCVEISQTKKLREAVSYTLGNSITALYGGFVEGDLEVNPRSAGDELDGEFFRWRHRTEEDIRLLRLRAAELAARTFPIEEARSSGATRIASPGIAMGVGAVLGAIITGYASSRGASRQR
jgi:hypothetical protein